jgi:hypothetical protein
MVSEISIFGANDVTCDMIRTIAKKRYNDVFKQTKSCLIGKKIKCKILLNKFFGGFLLFRFLRFQAI